MLDGQLSVHEVTRKSRGYQCDCGGHLTRKGKPYSKWWVCRGCMTMFWIQYPVYCQSGEWKGHGTLCTG